MWSVFSKVSPSSSQLWLKAIALTYDRSFVDNISAGEKGIVAFHDVIAKQRGEIRYLAQKNAEFDHLLQLKENDLMIARTNAEEDRAAMEMELKAAEAKLRAVELEFDKATDQIREFAQDLKKPRRTWNLPLAAQKYEQLFTIADNKISREEPRLMIDHESFMKLKFEALRWKHEFAATWNIYFQSTNENDSTHMSHNDEYLKACSVAKEVWIARKEIPDNIAEIRESLKLYGSLLSIGREYERAKRLYIYEWHDEDLFNPNSLADRQYKEEIGLRLGKVSTSLNDYLDAESYHRKVLKMRKIEPRNLEKEGECVCELVSVLQLQNKWDSTIDILDRFQQEKPKDMEVLSVLKCANDFGDYLRKNNRAPQAESLLRWAYEGRKRYGEVHYQLAVFSAKILAETYSSLGKFGLAEDVYSWICKELKNKPLKDSEKVENQFCLSLLRREQRKFAQAEQDFHRLWDTYKKKFIQPIYTPEYTPNNTTIQVLVSGCYYAELSINHGTFTEAGAAVTKEVFEARKKMLGEDDIYTLECWSMHGAMLRGLATKVNGKYSDAESVLQNLWNHLSPKAERFTTQEKDIALSTARDLAYCLISQRKPVEAQKVLNPALKWVPKSTIPETGDDYSERWNAYNKDLSLLLEDTKPRPNLKTAPPSPKLTMKEDRGGKVSSRQWVEVLNWFAGGKTGSLK